MTRMAAPATGRRRHPHAAGAPPTVPAAADDAPAQERLLRIGEAARKVGVSPSALRGWEHQGLVTPGRTDAGYRLYTEADIARLHEIHRMRTEERLNAPGIRRLLEPSSGAGPREATMDGAALRELRSAQGLSLREAAARSGLSMSFISAVERGATRASVATLQRLTSAYHVTVGELLTRRENRRVVRAGERVALDLAGDGVRIEQLADGARRLEPHLFWLAPDASSQGAYRHKGEEFLFVMTGSLTIWVGEHERHTLRAGDALTFPSTLPHRWHNNPREETRLLWINTPPTF
jgi:DNA-binding transcriptional MerR regulator/quercetin dioxygenase-like cupin family protein